jgi:hypothetical protein
VATLSGLIDRARLELGDLPRPFICQTPGDDLTTLIETPFKPIQSSDLRVVSNDNIYVPNFVVDERNGIISLAEPIPPGVTILVTGTAFRYFTTAEWEMFVSTSALQHTHNRSGVTLNNLDPVEEYPVSLLAVTEALFALINDAAFDIDISTPEGVGIPRHQRYEQLMEMLVARTDQYNKLSSALNVGLNRIEMFDLRRKSLTTGRFVQTFITQELEDARFPVRAFVPIDTDGTTPGPDSVPKAPITIIQKQPYTANITVPHDLTGAEVRVTLRKYKASGAFKFFTVVITDAVNGKLTASLSADMTYTLGGGPYWWDLQTITHGISSTLVEGPVTIEERARI